MSAENQIKAAGLVPCPVRRLGPLRWIAKFDREGWWYETKQGSTIRAWFFLGRMDRKSGWRFWKFIVGPLSISVANINQPNP